MNYCKYGMTIITCLIFAACGGNNDSLGPRGEVIGTPKVIGSTVTAAQLDAANDFQALTGKAKCDVTVAQINYRTPGVQPGEMTNASAAVLIPSGANCPGPFPLIAYRQRHKPRKGIHYGKSL